jgi:malate dehydrogenase
MRLLRPRTVPDLLYDFLWELYSLMLRYLQTLSMAFAGARMADSLLRAGKGEKGVTEFTFVESPLYKNQGITFFSSKVTLGPEGVEEIHPVGEINDYEQKLLEACVQDLNKNIIKGENFAKNNP